MSMYISLFFQDCHACSADCDFNVTGFTFRESMCRMWCYLCMYGTGTCVNIILLYCVGYLTGILVTATY